MYFWSLWVCDRLNSGLAMGVLIFGFWFAVLDVCGECLCCVFSWIAWVDVGLFGVLLYFGVSVFWV